MPCVIFFTNMNTLEKLAHQYHMQEIYAAASPLYKQMKENPPQDPELCPCVNDVASNGILGELANIARHLKYFQSPRMPRARWANWACKEKYGRGRKRKFPKTCSRGRGGRSTNDGVMPKMIEQYDVTSHWKRVCSTYTILLLFVRF